VRIVVIGGGIAGLSAALRLHDELGSAAQITVIDGAATPGGKLRTGEIGGRAVETGAETFLARAADDPSGAPSAAVRLARRVGLGNALISPETLSAGILWDGMLRPMPAGTLMGVPADLDRVDWAPTAAADHDLGEPVLPAGEDAAVGALVRARMGDAIVDRLVDPLLGGVYAGRADDLSVAVTMPGLAAALRVEHTLQDAVRHALLQRVPTSGSPFASVEGGLSRLVEAVVAAMPAVIVRTGQPVREMARSGLGWRLTVGSTRDPEPVDADAIVLAVPSHPAARLLGPGLPAVADLVGSLDYASIGLVTIVLPDGTLDRTALAGKSGALIPAIEGHVIKAVTVFSSKWRPQPDGAVLLRASVGRYGDPSALAFDDETLAAVVYDDLAKILGGPLPRALDTRVNRWGGALPQYAPGHSARVARARASLPPTLTMAGAAYDGVGIPACIDSGERAAATLIEQLS
jgi:oxygen-dependent protoporphyrinogen oxidase